MIRHGEAVFVDSGAWIALALVRDPFHVRAKETWDSLLGHGVRVATSVPIVLETFTFLERNAHRDVALEWKDALAGIKRLRMIECKPADVRSAWSYFERRDLHKLSAVDATSFVLMKRAKVRLAFTFDHHFAVVGFRIAS